MAGTPVSGTDASVSSPAELSSASHPWGTARMLLGAALLGYVWRLQDLFPVANAAKPVLLVSVAFLLVLLLDRRLPAEFARAALRPPGILALILTFLVLVGVPFSLYQGMSLDLGLKDMLPAAVLMIGLTAAIELPLDAERFAAMHVVGAAVFSTFIVLKFQVGPSGRLGNLVYYDANGAGFVLVCALPLAYWFVLHGRSIVARLASATVIVMILLTVIKSGSRGAFLGLASVVAYTIFFSRASSPLRRVFLGVACATMLLVASTGEYWTMMDTMLHPTKDYNWVGNSQTGRMDVWKRGIGYMMERPIGGVGAGAFGVAEGTISNLAQRQDYGVGLKWSAAHNSFVEIGAELGFPGLIAFLALLLVGFRRARTATAKGLASGDLRAAALGDALAASFVGFCVSGFFLSQAYNVISYSLVGIAAGLEGTLSWRASTVAAVQSTDHEGFATSPTPLPTGPSA